MSEKRLAYWDNLKGLMILFVVFGHMLYQLTDTFSIADKCVDMIYVFHMPVFVFISGYFGKSEINSKTIGLYLFLFFAMHSIMGFIYGFESILIPMYSSWYLLALSVWRIFTPKFCKSWISCIVLIFVSLLVGFLSEIDNTLAVCRIIGFYPYYVAGYLMDKQRVDDLCSLKYKNRLITGILVISVAFFVSFVCDMSVGFGPRELMMYPYGSPLFFVVRLFIYLCAGLYIYGFLCITPDFDIRFLSDFGRNSLFIYVMHRIFTLVISDYMKDMDEWAVIAVSLISSIGVCFLFANKYAEMLFDRFKQSVYFLCDTHVKRISLARVLSGLIVVCYVSLAFFEIMPVSDAPVVYNVISDEQKTRFSSAFKLSFVGDLILLEDQIRAGYDAQVDSYDFNDIFAYTNDIISSADMAIGVFEGPMAGQDKGYSVGNFDDNKALYLNYPDEFAVAVRNAGFDLVTVAMNHLMDKGISGALRTLDALDNAGLSYVGGYRSVNDKQLNRVKVVEQSGIRFAILSYTYGFNNMDMSDFIHSDDSYISSYAYGMRGSDFDELKQQVVSDFDYAKSFSPDIIIVLPHMGEQFSNGISDEQAKWYKIFVDNGADVILGDHAHAVEPIIMHDYNGRIVFEAYCPGNFVNTYRKQQGDASIITNVYIDRDTKTVIGGSVVPLYCQKNGMSNYRAVPIYKILNDADIRSGFSSDDIVRADEANKVITKVLFGSEISINAATENYYFDHTGYLRSVADICITDGMMDSDVFKLISNAESISFVGDSITAGSNNGGAPWYEPLFEYFDNKSVYNLSKGGATVKYAIDNADKLERSDLYVVAIGTNDVRYRDADICAMTSDEYVDRVNLLVNCIRNRNADAKILFIAPWFSRENDIYRRVGFSYDNIVSLNESYSDALKTYAHNNDYYYVNLNDDIRAFLKSVPDSYLYSDTIHPSSGNGVRIYSELFLSSDFE